MNANQHQAFFHGLDQEARANKIKKPTPAIWILFTEKVVSTEGLLEALCSYIATKNNARSCTLFVSNEGEEDKKEPMYKGLHHVAAALGNIPTLEVLCMDRPRMYYPDHLFGEISLNVYGDEYYFIDKDPILEINLRYEAIVLSHVRQITEFMDSPYDCYLSIAAPPVLYVEEFSEVLQHHPLLSTVTLGFRLDHIRIQEALLSLPTLTAFHTLYMTYFTEETIGRFVTKSSMRRLHIHGLESEVPMKEWSVLCRALGRKSTRLVFLSFTIDRVPSHDEFWAELSKALMTNESLTFLILQTDLEFYNFANLSPSNGAVLAHALAHHPRLYCLQLVVPSCYLAEAWEELFCNGIAQMKSLRVLTLLDFPLKSVSVQLALRQLVLRLSTIRLYTIETKEDWKTFVNCVICSRRLMTFEFLDEKSVKPILNRSFKETEMLRGFLAMNKAGRTYVMDDTGNRRKALSVLNIVKYNLSCLYIHLRESPLILLGFLNASNRHKCFGRH